MKAKPAKVTGLPRGTIDARLLLKVLSDYKRGDFTTRLPPERTGLTGKIYDALNEVIELNEQMAKEFARVATVAGKQGRIKRRAALPMAAGSWGECMDSVNTLIVDLIQLEERANLLAKQNLDVERKNQEIERGSRALREKAEQLALTSKYKSEFLANMSHDLRTPLNSMLILAKLLAESENLTDKQREFARTICSSGSDLLQLIDEILDLSKIESGMMEVEIGRVMFKDLCEYVERNFRQVAHDKGLEFSVYGDPALPPGIYTDQRRLQQVLKNLLSNAFKFTEHGKVRISITAAKNECNPGNKVLNDAESVIAFTVEDTGIGIAPDKQRIIFEAFQQADGSITRKYGGTGLGLSISREIATLLGGKIQLTSTAGQGSTFTLYLPLSYTPERKRRRPHVSARIEELAPAGTPRIESAPLIMERILDDERSNMRKRDPLLAGKKVLIIDDDIRSIFALTSLLERHDMQVLYSENGRDGIEMLKRTADIDVGLVDIMMPGMDGYEAMRQIRNMKEFMQVPLIALTAKAMKGDREKCIGAGASDYITKPADSEQLLSLLRVWLFK
jgi:hypothetical protein